MFLQLNFYSSFSTPPPHPFYFPCLRSLYPPLPAQQSFQLLAVLQDSWDEENCKKLKQIQTIIIYNI